MNDELMELMDSAFDWWELLDDGQKSNYLIELYCKEKNIRIE